MLTPTKRMKSHIAHPVPGVLLCSSSQDGEEHFVRSSPWRRRRSRCWLQDTP